jgi:uncharacterized iron-regulated membrane protein
MSTSIGTSHEHTISPRQRWLHYPETSRVHRFFFQTHLWLGMMAGLYIFVMSLTGSILVFRNQLESNPASRVSDVVEWVVNLHENLLFGSAGRGMNGIGAICLTLLCLTGAIIWWPGIDHWRRSLSVNWSASAPRLNWDLHNALGFWMFFFVTVWGISGVYFVFPNAFTAMGQFLGLVSTTSKLKLGDLALAWLSNLHFGRFDWFTEALWTIMGLVPAVLAFTGIFMCCHRLLIRKGAPLPR